MDYWNGLRYRGGHIPSRIFWILDESGIVKHILKGVGDRFAFLVVQGFPRGYAGT